MVFYQQQTNRIGDPWIEPKKAQFERALGVPEGMAKLARDVAFFFIEKAATDTDIAAAIAE